MPSVTVPGTVTQLVAGGNISGITGEQVKGRAGYFIVKPVLMDGTYKLKEGDTVYLRCPLSIALNYGLGHDKIIVESILSQIKSGSRIEERKC